MSYALYKFHKAIISLQGTELQKRQWLTSSYVHHIIHLHDEDLPIHVRGDFQKLCDTLTKVPARWPTDSLEQTVRAMDISEINAVVNRILSIYDAIRVYERAGERLEA